MKLSTYIIVDSGIRIYLKLDWVLKETYRENVLESMLRFIYPKNPLSFHFWVADTLQLALSRTVLGSKFSYWVDTR